MQHGIILTNYQVARRCIPDAGWAIDLVPLDPREVVSTKRETALSFINLSRSLVTGARCQLYIPGLARPATVDEITRGLVVDGYALGLGEGWQVHPGCWFGLPGTNMEGVTVEDC